MLVHTAACSVTPCPTEGTVVLRAQPGGLQGGRRVPRMSLGGSKRGCSPEADAVGALGAAGVAAKSGVVAPLACPLLLVPNKVLLAHSRAQVFPELSCRRGRLSACHGRCCVAHGARLLGPLHTRGASPRLHGASRSLGRDYLRVSGLIPQLKRQNGIIFRQGREQVPRPGPPVVSVALKPEPSGFFSTSGGLSRTQASWGEGGGPGGPVVVPPE